jgi:hypothetical protein
VPALLSAVSSLPTVAVIRQRIRENDPVALREQIGKWPAGTLGAAVDIYDGAALVEIVDDNGRTLDLLTVPNELLEVQGPRA